MDEVPNGTTFDLLPSEGAALYPDSHASLKSAPVELNDSLDDGSGKDLNDSLDLANENAVELVEPVSLTGSLHLSDALAEDEPAVTTVTQIAQQDSRPSPTTAQPSFPVQPTPLSLTEESTTTNCTWEGEASSHNAEKVSQGHKIAPSFGKKRPAFKPPKMGGKTTATDPSKMEQGKMNPVDTSPGSENKATANKCTPVQAQPSGKVDEEESKTGKESMQESSKKTKPQPSSKSEKKTAKQVDNEGKRIEQEKRKEESEKKKLQQQQKKLEKQQKLEEKEAERERKKQDRERKEREREEKRQEKERKAQERAQKKHEKELKEQGKEMKKQEREKKRLGKEKQDKDKGMVPHITLLPASLPTSASMSRDNSQSELELTDMKDNNAGNGETKEADGGAKHEEMEDQSKGRVDSIAVSSDKEDDLDTTVEGNCSDDQSEAHDSSAVGQNTEMSTIGKVSDTSMETDNQLCVETLNEGNSEQKTIPKEPNVLFSTPAQKKRFTPPNAPKAMAPQKRSVDAGENNSRPTKKVKTMDAEKKNAPKPKAVKEKSQKLKAESEAEKNSKQNLGVTAAQAEKPLPVWIQCGSCKKWRVVYDCADPSTLPDEWTCSMNSDVSVQSCSVPEMDWPDLTNSQEYVYSQFAQGSVVWAKQQGYPSWPGMIDNDPDIGVCMSWEEENPPEDVPPSEYHVVYFGKPVSRAWVEAADVEPFTENCPQTEGLGVYAKALDAAKREAQAALQETTEVRLRKYSFVKRYGKGKRKAKQRRAADRDDEEVLPSKKSRRLPVKTPLQDNGRHDMASADTSEVAQGDSSPGEYRM